ncbi:hypothetical protein [Legionella sp. CNM-4043-24]
MIKITFNNGGNQGYFIKIQRAVLNNHGLTIDEITLSGDVSSTISI